MTTDFIGDSDHTTHFDSCGCEVRKLKLALAASQARERELREMVTGMLPATESHERWCNGDGDAPCDCGEAEQHGAFPWVKETRALLAAPTDDSALRGLCERVGENVWDRAQRPVGLQLKYADVQNAVNEVLGPGAAPIAAEIKEKG